MLNRGSRKLRVLAIGFVACLFVRPLFAGDDPSAKQLAFALQDAFADAIARAEPSLVSIVRIRTAEGALADSLLTPQDDARRIDTRRLLRDRINA